MLRHLTVLTLNLTAGAICFSTMPHLSGLCFGLALSTCFDLLRIWPDCNARWGDHLCTRMRWHLGRHCCGGTFSIVPMLGADRLRCGCRWPRWLTKPDS